MSARRGQQKREINIIPSGSNFLGAEADDTALRGNPSVAPPSACAPSLHHHPQ